MNNERTRFFLGFCLSQRSGLRPLERRRLRLRSRPKNYGCSGSAKLIENYLNITIATLIIVFFYWLFFFYLWSSPHSFKCSQQNEAQLFLKSETTKNLLTNRDFTSKYQDMYLQESSVTAAKYSFNRSLSNKPTSNTGSKHSQHFGSVSC